MNIKALNASAKPFAAGRLTVIPQLPVVLAVTEQLGGSAGGLRDTAGDGSTGCHEGACASASGGESDGSGELHGVLM